jgi:hypothetical protein
VEINKTGKFLRRTHTYNLLSSDFFITGIVGNTCYCSVLNKVKNYRVHLFINEMDEFENRLLTFESKQKKRGLEITKPLTDKL